MGTIWTRERIIRHILDREGQGLPFTFGEDGIDSMLYSAAWRIFGSWRNALLAAGIPSERVRTWERWSPSRIVSQIRALSRRRRPLTTRQREARYRNLVSAARRYFGSWFKAILAAGVDPMALQRVVPWTRERVIEAILMRALRGQSLVARLIEQHSLPEAGHRFFGSWRAAVAAAGLDLKLTEMPPRRKKRRQSRSAPESDHAPPYKMWSKERVVECIQARVRESKRMNASAVTREFPRLYAAAHRHFHGWDEAMRAAGLDPDTYRPRRLPAWHRSSSRMSESHGNDAVRLAENE